MSRRLRAAFLALLVASPAFAAPPPGADPDSPMSKWFRGLRIPENNGSCCDESDCRVTTAQFRDGKWYAITEDGWEAEVPAAKVLKDQAHPAGSAVLCWRRDLGVMCFVPPGAGI
jgi:hypothetical protein